jgi:hypothetical protein
MYKLHPAFQKPRDENAKIWRYMDFTKFVSLVDKQELFFARADKLGDPFEGSYPKGNVQQRASMHKKWLDTLPIQFRNLFEQRPKALSEFYKNLRRFIFINSWHKNEHESDAMWKLYLKSDEGIAIQSTFSRLRDCFSNETPDIYIGEVRYVDYSREVISEGNFFYPFLHKRKNFEHEKELRAVIFEFPKEPPFAPPFGDGIPVSVDLDILIDRISLAPTSPKWLRELVESVIRKYGLEREVIQSSLSDRPAY